MKKIFIIFILFFLSEFLFAVSAYKNAIELIQPDGSKINVRLFGDEFYHWYEDSEGYTILKDASSGKWVYAEKNSNGSLSPSQYPVDKISPGSLKIKKSMKDDILLSNAKRKAKSFSTSILQKTLSTGFQRASVTGAKANLVILVNFNDRYFTIPQSNFEDLLNGANYTYDGAKGSLKEYYNEVSYGKFTFDSVVTATVTIPNNYRYYGQNDSYGYDLRPREMVRDALIQLDATSFDFSQVDLDNDGWIDSLVVIHAGCGEEAGASSDTIWSHRWQITSTYTTHDGKKVLDYATVPEKRGNNEYSNYITRIGVVCHELMHILDMPDLYDTTYLSSGLGDFCLMASGSWNGTSGESPAHPCAWIKYKLGWNTPQIPSDGMNTIGLSVTSDSAFYKLTGNDFDSREYFLMENRQSTGFDTGLPGTQRGILIYHVDERKWNNGDNDNSAHYLVDIEEADGTSDWTQDDLAVAPYHSGLDSDYFRNNTVTVFNDDCISTPNSKSYTSQLSGIKISQISASSSLMSFVFGQDINIVDDLSKVVCFPNPARDGQVTITNLPISVDKLDVIVYTMSGQSVESFSIDDTSFDGEGRRYLEWDCKNHSGDNVAPGVYFILLKTNSDKATKKIAIIR
ncbi:MAG: M6 family metalloprotease domain-containing protein [Endomicrobiaceae bacterium]|nr:M6 family metalloprotease domain-containing protein [Endomicrobiaceae bacterium]